MRTIFLRALDATDKAAAISAAISDPLNENRFDVDPTEFSTIPGSPFSYWVSRNLRHMFEEHPSFEGSGRTAKVGLQTSDDFRFVRAWWEINPRTDDRWFPLAKGGAFSPIYADLHLSINWHSDGHELKAWAGSLYNNSHWSRILKNIDFFMRPGLTWPRRTNGLSLRVMPRGSVFADKGPVAFVDGDDPQRLLALGGVVNSRPFNLLVSLQLARTELAQSFEVGLIQQTPVPHMSGPEVEELASLVQQIWTLKRDADSRVETSHAFSIPALLQVEGDDLAARTDAWIQRTLDTHDRVARLQAAVDAASSDLYRIGSVDIESPKPSVEEAPIPETILGDDTDDDSDDEANIDEVASTYASKIVLSAELASWALGAAIGRFDVRLANTASLAPFHDPFETLPRYSPGMLVDALFGPGTTSPESYLTKPTNTGVLVDDPGHPDDLGQHVHNVFEMVFGNGAERWLKELAGTLSPAESDLRRWFADEFFDFHLRRYTKSKRRAPIYWQVAVPSGRYSIWLYAPTITSDTLFRLQQDIVAPKIAHEERTLASMRQEGAPHSTQAQRELDEQDNFVSELRQLADEIQRVAPLWNPDTDDGIVLAMSPLWRVVPRHKAWQKELRAKWQDLQSGKYDWTHLAMHLWPERVVPKCAKDRSLAIAHGLENEFWLEDEHGKWKPRKSPLRPIDELISERASTAVKDALKNLLEAPDPLSTNKRSRKSKAA